jgi:hypothetical protein
MQRLVSPTAESRALVRVPPLAGVDVQAAGTAVRVVAANAIVAAAGSPALQLARPEQRLVLP